jgi:hypothetical protein
MISLYLILPVILIVFLSFLIVRTAAILLVLTGMDLQRARFQALSAFTRAGFTTRESEMVVRQPARRKIIIWLMILGNAGIITVMVTATSAFVTSRGIFVGLNFALLAVGGVALWLVGKYSGLGARWERYIVKKFGRAPKVEDVFCEDLTHLAEGYGVLRVHISPDSRFSGKPISQIAERAQFRVLGVERDDDWLALPKGQEIVQVGDSLIVFGRLRPLRTMFAEKSTAA